MTKSIVIVSIILLRIHLCLGQVSAQDITFDNKNFDALADSIIKLEVASFTTKGAYLRKTDSASKPILTEIPIRSCSDKAVHLSRSTFTSSVSTFIHVYFKGEVPNKRLDSIFVVTHSHFWVKIPKTAFQGLPQTNLCELSVNGNGKKATFFSRYYKAFYSMDKRRLYIYMQGGVDSSKYEVTWVIIDDKYYTRIFDNIQ